MRGVAGNTVELDIPAGEGFHLLGHLFVEFQLHPLLVFMGTGASRCIPACMYGPDGTFPLPLDHRHRYR